MLPSGDEAQRLKRTLKNCTVRYFKDNGHNILMVCDNKWLYLYLCLI
jgi:hypothetical protein